MDIEYLLEKYLEKKGINPEKVDEDLFNNVVSRIEDTIEDFIRDDFNKFAEDWAFEIEQELPEHPEWKLK